MKKFFIHSTFVVAFVLLNISVYAVDGGIVSGPSREGTEENPYLISSEKDFDDFMQQLRKGKNYKNTFFLQTCDIIFNNSDYYDGSNSTEKFRGVYDGGGHTISFPDGTTLNKRVDKVGLFTYADEATIKNLTLSNLTIDAQGHDYVGFFVGQGDGITMENCKAKNCTIINGGNDVGGLVGYAKSGGTFINCSVSKCTITSSGGPVGGLIGEGKDVLIYNCETYKNNLKGGSVGGFVGLDAYCTLVSCTEQFSTLRGQCGAMVSSGHHVVLYNCTASNISDCADLINDREECDAIINCSYGNSKTDEYKPRGEYRTCLTNDIVSDIANQEYSGQPIIPDVSIIDKTLDKDNDYITIFENNINAGDAKVRIIGCGRYYYGVVNKKFTIEPKPITLTVDDTEKIYGADDPRFTYTVEGLVSGDELSSVKFQRESGETPGSYTVNAKVSKHVNRNYNVTCIPGVLIIHDATISGALSIVDYGTYTTAIIDGNYNGSIPFNLDNDLAVANVTFERKFTPNRYSTIILPFDVPNPSACGKFYTFSGVQYVNGQWEAQVVETSEVKANTPYIFYPSSSKPPLPDGVTKLVKTEGTLSQDNANGNWTLKGMYNYYQWPTDAENDYGFAGKTVSADNIEIGQFIKVGAESWINPFRCYLTYNGNSTDLSKSTVILPDCIIVRVVEPDEIPSFQPVNNEIITPITETTPESAVKVWSYNKTIIIESQPYTNYTIVDLTGRILKTGVTHSTHEEVSLNCNTGIVIVNINGKTFKINY